MSMWVNYLPAKQDSKNYWDKPQGFILTVFLNLRLEKCEHIMLPCIALNFVANGFSQQEKQEDFSYKEKERTICPSYL